MKASIKANAVWIFAGVSLFLCVFFLMPSGAPGAAQTPHSRLKGLAARFGDSEKTPKAAAGNGSFGQAGGRRAEPADKIAAFLRQRLAPHEAEGVLAYLEKQEKRRIELERQIAARPKVPPPARTPRKPRAARRAAQPKPAVNKPASPKPPEPAHAPPVPLVRMSRERAARTWYDKDLSKFPLNLEFRKGGILCVLEGLSRWTERDSYLVRLRLENKTEADFFVKDIYVSAGGKRLPAERYFELFVGPGTSKTALVAFAKPETGTDVRISVEEDAERGRLLTGRIDYPF